VGGGKAGGPPAPPADSTYTNPARIDFLIASSSDVSGVCHRAALMFTTAGLAPCAVIQSTARTAAAISVRVVPVHGRMRSAWIFAAGATPKVRPAAMLATCVP